MAIEIKDSFRIIDHLNNSGQPQAWITFTGRSGSLEGLTLVDGEIRDDPQHGTVVVFVRKLDNAPVWERLAKTQGLKKSTSIVLKASDKPELAELVARARDAVAAELARIEDQARTAEPTGYTYEAGCDTYDSYRVLWPEETSYRAQQVRGQSIGCELIRKYLRSADFDAVAKETGAEPIEANLATYGGWRFDRAGLNALMDLARNRHEAKTGEGFARKQASEAKQSQALAGAIQSGKPVELARWTEDCDGSVEECSTDILYRYAMPDGSIEVRRTHTH